MKTTPSQITEALLVHGIRQSWTDGYRHGLNKRRRVANRVAALKRSKRARVRKKWASYEHPGGPIIPYYYRGIRVNPRRRDHWLFVLGLPFPYFSAAPTLQMWNVGDQVVAPPLRFIAHDQEIPEELFTGVRRADYPDEQPMDDDKVENKLKALCEKGERIQAIKLARAHYVWTIREAWEYVKDRYPRRP